MSTLINVVGLFDLESHPNCAWDYLEIRDSISPTFHYLGVRLCGDRTRFTHYSIGPSLTLIFHSDALVTRSGFKITAEEGNNQFYES